jgi:hypothetical protein
MAIIQIPIGGQAVGIEVPDFAMDTTLRELVELTKQNVGAITSLSNSVNRDSISDSSRDTRSDAENKGLLSSIRDSIAESRFGRGVSAVADMATSPFVAALESGTFSDFITTVGSSIPIIGSVAAGFGTVVGMAEQMSQSMNNLTRIGGSTSMSLIELRNEAASVGLGLHELTKIIGLSGKTVASLGNTTTDGTKKFSQMLVALTTATRDIGYMGMTAGEQSQYLLDELEIRRQLSNTMEMQNLDSNKLIGSMKEQFIQQTALSRLTGQDVRDAQRASQEYRRQSVSAGILASLNERQASTLTDVVGQLAGLGDTAPMVTAALNSLMTVGAPDVGSPEFTGFAAMLQSAGVDIRSALSGIQQAVYSGDNSQADYLVQSLMASIKNISGEDRFRLAQYETVGVGGAGTAGMASMQTAATNAATSIDNFTTRLNESIRQVRAEIESGAVSFVGIQRDFEVTQENLMASMMNMALAMTGTDPANEQEFRNAITSVSGTAIDMAEATRLLSITVGQAGAEAREQLVAAFNDSALGQAIAATIPSLTGAINGINSNIESLQATVAQFRNDTRRP